MDKIRCPCGSWLLEININRSRHIDSKTHQAYLTRKGKEESVDLPVSNSVPISKFTKINAFTDVLPKELAELCLGYEEYPRLNHLDIIAGAMGFWHRAICNYRNETDDDELYENPQLEFISLHLLEFSLVDYIEDLEDHICDNIQYAYDHECKYIGTIIETKYEHLSRAYKHLKLYDLEPTEMDLCELYPEIFQGIYSDFGIKFKKASELYRFSLISFLATIPVTNMKKICNPLIYSHINERLLETEYDGNKYGRNYKIPEFMKKILIKELYGTDPVKPTQHLKPIYTRDRHVDPDTGRSIYTNFQYKENVKRTVRIKMFFHKKHAKNLPVVFNVP